MTAKSKKITASQNNVQASLGIEETGTQSADLPESFEAAYAELQSIVSTMESGQMSLESSLTAYKRGDALLQFCQKTLSDVEQQVHILTEQNTLETYQADLDRNL
jgi:exodeoxyribonuclease VII small subunit